MARPRISATTWAVLGLAVLAALPALWLYPFPSQDGHQHAFTAFAYGRISDPQYGFSAWLAPSFPMSSQGYVLLMVLLDMVMPFAVAERLALALVLAAFPLGGWVYWKLARTESFGTSVLLTLLAFSWPLVMGFWNFMLAFALLAPAAGLAVRLGDGRLRSYLALAAMLVAMAWLHLTVAVLAGLVVVTVSAFGDAGAAVGAGARVRRVLATGLAGIPSAAYAVFAATRYVDDNRPVGTITPLEAIREPLGRRLLDLFAMGPGGVSVVTGIAACTLALLVLVGAARARGPGAGRRRALALLGACVFLAFLVAPLHAARWAFMSPRLLLGGMVVLALAGAATASRRAQAALLVVGVVGVVGAGWNLTRLEVALRPVVRALTQLERPAPAPLLPLELEAAPIERLPRHLDPTLHLGARALIASGGISPYLFAINPAIHAVVYTQSPLDAVGPAPGVYLRRGLRCEPELTPAECVAQRERLIDRIAYYGLYWRDVVLLHAPPIAEFRLRQRGYRLAFQQDGVAQWQARPGGVRLSLALAETSRGPLVVRAGLRDSVGWIRGASLPPGLASGALPPLVLGPLPAGPVDIEAFVDEDGDGAPSAGEYQWCPRPVRIEAGREQRIEARLVRE
jgi:hypothetical protein